MSTDNSELEAEVESLRIALKDRFETIATMSNKQAEALEYIKQLEWKLVHSEGQLSDGKRENDKLRGSVDAAARELAKYKAESRAKLKATQAALKAALGIQ